MKLKGIRIEKFPGAFREDANKKEKAKELKELGRVKLVVQEGSLNGAGSFARTKSGL
jgi:hypothetical protein